MSKHATMRQQLAASIIAANIGWTDQTVVHKRTTSLFNAIATCVATAKNGIVLHIGVTSGNASDENALHLDLDVPITIIRSPEVEEEAEPEEEQLWEDLVKHVHGLTLGDEEYAWRFRIKSFQDIEIEADDGTAYFGRQTIFTKTLSIY